jgi:hypothetical protein
MDEDEELTLNEEDHNNDTSFAIHYSVDIETKNSKLSPAERKALRNMVQLMLGEAAAKLQFVLDNPANAIVKAHVSGSSSGRSELPPLRGDD